MVSALHEFGRNTAGTKIDRGFYAVDPSGHLVLLPPSAPLKAGWRLATREDIDAKQFAEEVRKAEAEQVAAPAIED